MNINEFSVFLKNEYESEYGRLSRVWRYGLYSAMPLVAYYQIALPYFNRGIPPEEWYMNSGMVILQYFATLFGVLPGPVGMMLIVAAFAGTICYGRMKNGPLVCSRSCYLRTIMEALCAAAVIKIICGLIATAIPLSVGTYNPAEPTLAYFLTTSAGDGFFEELVFRVIMVGGLWTLLKKMNFESVRAGAIAIIVVAIGFSIAHFYSANAEPFTWFALVNRSSIGVMLGIIFLFRGFGTAAWTHAFYNAMLYIQAFLLV